MEAVWAWGDLNTHKPLELLTQLVNKSIVVPKPQPGQETRYYLLESIRQYAREQLERVGELEKFQHGHLTYFNLLGDEVKPNLVGPEQVYFLTKSTVSWIISALRWRGRMK